MVENFIQIFEKRIILLGILEYVCAMEGVEENPWVLIIGCDHSTVDNKCPESCSRMLHLGFHVVQKSALMF
jgi:hypothetical protein